MYKVFFKRSFFLLSDDSAVLQKDPAVFIHGEKQATRELVFCLLESQIPFRQVIYSPDIHRLQQDFRSFFREIQAAGGVATDNGRLLVIKRSGIYDLPKGHIETGESPEAGAMREVEEECGIGGLQITGSLPDTWHLYDRNGQWHLKRTYWYLMSCTPGQQPVPQTEEDIEEARWVSPEQFSALCKDTYPSLQPVFEYVLANYTKQ